MEHVEHVLSNISGCPGILQMKPSITVLVSTAISQSASSLLTVYEVTMDSSESMVYSWMSAQGCVRCIYIVDIYIYIYIPVTKYCW